MSVLSLHPGTPARLAALREVAKDAGAPVNQVVLAWLTGAEVPVIPLAGLIRTPGTRSACRKEVLSLL